MKNLFGEKHIDIGETYNNIGSVLEQMGKFNEAY